VLCLDASLKKGGCDLSWLLGGPKGNTVEVISHSASKYTKRKYPFCDFAQFGLSEALFREGANILELRPFNHKLPVKFGLICASAQSEGHVGVKLSPNLKPSVISAHQSITHPPQDNMAPKNENDATGSSWGERHSAEVGKARDR